MDSAVPLPGTRKRRRTPADAKDKVPSLRLACPLCAHNPERYEFITEKSCRSEAGFSNMQLVIQHLIRYHLHICRRCKTRIKAGSKDLKVQGKYREALRSHPNCVEREWDDGEQATHAEILTDAQQQLVLEWSSRSQRKRLHGEPDDLELWKELYKGLFPEDEICPNPRSSYTIPRHQHNKIMTDNLAYIRNLEAQITVLQGTFNSYPQTLDFDNDGDIAKPLGLPSGEEPNMRQEGDAEFTVRNPAQYAIVARILDQGMRSEFADQPCYPSSDSGYNSMAPPHQAGTLDGETLSDDHFGEAAWADNKFFP